MLNLIRKPIEAEMARFEEERRRVLSSGNPLLGLALAHVSARQGKMMRPMLVFLMAKAAGASPQAVMRAALALELLHTASLVHDDVVDKSDRRRGQASVNALFDNQAAVLVGDYILSCALRQAALTGCAPFVEALAALGQQLADGELLQLHSMDVDDISEEQYYEVIRRKTASLFATCAAAPSVLAGDDGGGQRAYRLGELMGLVFQMRDDLLDLDPDSRTGKPAGNDMREGKLTLAVIRAVAAEPALRDSALRVRRHEASDADILSLTAAAHAHGTQYAARRMDSLTAEAHSLADDMAAPGDMAAALHTYIDYVTRRES